MSDTVTNMDTPLTGHDRCDRCGAQAYTRATLPMETELLFCAHHAKEHLPALEDAGARIFNEPVPA